MNYIKRDIEQLVLDLSMEYSAILVSGPRQVGKSTMLEKLFPSMNKISLDDLMQRSLAQKDPEMFLKLQGTPILIDEVQYAPQLFSYIKIAIDKGAVPGSFILTGSQAFKLMSLAQETLAGRVAILSMSSLSQHEIHGSSSLQPFEISLESLTRRKECYQSADVNEMFCRIWEGQMPAHISGKFTNRDIFYSSYVQTYISRDIGEDEEGKGIDKMRFLDFIKASASRIGQILNLHSIAQDTGISDSTASRWIGMLEKSSVLYYLHPYSNNLLKRTIKAPKLYFFDTGLVAYLCRYNTPGILQEGAINGAILENYVINEIRKSYLNLGKEAPLFYYHDRDGKEIDIVIEENQKTNPIEVKKTNNPTSEMIASFTQLDKASKLRGSGAIICMKDDLFIIDRQVFIIPAWML
jgi:predicted AAA+ superfamily ATPase